MLAMLDDRSLDPDLFVENVGAGYADSIADDEEALVFRLAHRIRCNGVSGALNALFPGVDFRKVKGIDRDVTNGDTFRGHESYLAWAARIIANSRAARRNAQRVAARLQRWRAAAMGGDVRALLAIPAARRILFVGDKGITAYCPKRKSIAEAHAIVADRLTRAAARRAANSTPKPGRWRELYVARLKDRARNIGEHYHRTVKSLYTSSRAFVAYGRGGQDDSDDNAYSKAYNSRYGGAKWKNAGARIDDMLNPQFVILETSRGTEVARIPLKGKS